jgi:hypothetical protein
MKEKAMLKKKCDINLVQTIELARQMIALAQTGYEQREDSGCGILYGILLDSGYRLLDLAQKEKQAHMQKGWWKNLDKKENKQPGD